MTNNTTYLSPNGQQLTRGNGPATRILVGTLEGVATLRREDPSARWTFEGRSLADRHIGELVYE